jgi:hypothetical protein
MANILRYDKNDGSRSELYLHFSEETQLAIAAALESSKVLPMLCLWGCIAAFALLPLLALIFVGLTREGAILIGLAWLLILIASSIYFSYRRIGRNPECRYESDWFIGQDI